MTNKRIISNSLYTMLEKIVVMLLSFFASVIVVRYLGPSEFGIFSYALSVVAVASSFTKFGLNSLLIKMFAENPKNTNEIFATSLFIKFVSSLVVVSFLSIYFYNYENSIFPLIIIVLLGLIIESFEGIKFIYSAKLLAKYITYSGIATALISVVLKLLFVYFEVPLTGFGAIYTFSIFLGIIFLYLLRKRANINIDVLQLWKSINFQKTKVLLGSAYPLYIAGISTAVFMKADQLMLQWLTNPHEVGIYSVAVTLASSFGFIPVAIATSFLPILSKTRSQSVDQYNQKTQLFANIMLIVVIPIVIVFSFFSQSIINSIYGVAFHESAYILSLYMLILIFIAFEGIISNLLIIENLQKYMMLSNGLGAILNIIFNIIFIPKFQAEGAVYATLISYIISHYFFYFFFSKTRKITVLQSKAFINMFKIKTYKQLLDFYQSKGSI